MNIYDEVYQAAFEDELEKIAFLDVNAVEDRLGTIFSPEQIEVAQGILDAAKEKSFVLRHPFLTGVIPAAVMTSVTHDEAVKNLARQYPDLKSAYEKQQERKAALEQAAASSSSVNVYNKE